MNVRAPGRASRLAAVWSLGYGLYRSYYALGGTIGMHGTPVSLAQWRRINAIGAAILFIIAVLAIILVNAWAYRRARPFLLVLCWIITVACVSHALIDIVQRIASLSGALTISYPFWQTIDRKTADLQDLFFNEPWFLIEGLLWAAIAWTGALRESPRRLWWVGSAVAAMVASTTVGLLSAFGVIGRMIIFGMNMRHSIFTDDKPIREAGRIAARSRTECPPSGRRSGNLRQESRRYPCQPHRPESPSRT